MNIKITILQLLVVLVVLVISITETIAQVNVSGHWTCNAIEQGNSYPQDVLIIQNGTQLTGQQFYVGTTDVFANVTGSIVGSVIALQFDYTTHVYTVDLLATIAGNRLTATWTSSLAQNGTLDCTRTEIGVNQNPSASNKRATAINLFCNRTGVNLSVAKCTVTVGDTGAPPRTTPTGEVTFVAHHGFFPGSGSCQIQQTPLSPGVSSCEIELQVPQNFPIGSRFPIDVTYWGDDTFQASSTAHELIEAGCVGTPDNPCSGAMSLGFTDIPKIVEGLLATVVSCGGNNAVNKSTTYLVASSRNATLPQTSEKKGSCDVSVKGSTTAGKILASIKDQNAYGAFAEEVLEQLGAKAFTKDDRSYLEGIADVSTMLYSHESAHQQLFNGGLTEEQIEERIDEMVLQRIQEKNNKVFSALPALKGKKLKLVTRNFNVKTTSVGSNKQKVVKLKASKSIQAILNALSSADLNYAPISLSLTGVRKGKVPEGAKKKVKITEQISVVIAR